MPTGYFSSLLETPSQKVAPLDSLCISSKMASKLYKYGLIPFLKNTKSLHLPSYTKMKIVAISFLLILLLRKEKHILDFTFTKYLFCHFLHCFCMNPVMPYKTTQHLSDRPHLTITSFLQSSAQKIWCSF